MRKSLVIGCHDGLEYLYYSLPCLAGLPVDEIVVVFDHVDYEFFKAFMERLPEDALDKLKPLFKTERKWKYARAETFNIGLSEATGDLLFVSAEDIILDPKNFSEEWWKDPEVGMVDFRYETYDPFRVHFRVAWEKVLVKIFDCLRSDKATQQSGIFGVRAELFRRFGMDDAATEENWLRKHVKDAGFKHVHVRENRGNIHLRPSNDKERQIMQGMSRFQLGSPLWKIVAHVVLHFKPWVLKGWLLERQR